MTEDSFSFLILFNEKICNHLYHLNVLAGTLKYTSIMLTRDISKQY